MGDVIVPVFQSTGAMLLWLAVTVLMPLVVGLITKPSTPASLQSLLLTAAALTNGLLSEALAAGDTYNWGKAALQAVVSFVIAVATHYGIFKPTGLTAAALAVGTRSDYRKAA